MKRVEMKGGMTFMLESFPSWEKSSENFRVRMLDFFLHGASPEKYAVEDIDSFWRTFLIDNRGIAFPLYAFELEDDNELCYTCQYRGCSQNSRTQRSYHFIIPVDSMWDNRLTKGVLDQNTHILHAVIHCNGIGHILGIKDSKYLCGRELMNLWDRICDNIQPMNISVTEKVYNTFPLGGESCVQDWLGGWGYKPPRTRTRRDQHYVEKSWNSRARAAENGLQYFLCKDTNTGVEEFVVVHVDASLADFKCAVEKAMSETYQIIKDFKLVSIEEFKDCEDSTKVCLEEKADSIIHVTMKKRSEEEQIVECVCGYNVSDGEMVQCDRCDVWGHCICCPGIDDLNAVPFYVCHQCRHLLTNADTQT